MRLDRSPQAGARLLFKDAPAIAAAGGRSEIEIRNGSNSIGRGADLNGIVLSDASVSGAHAAIEANGEEGLYTLKDVGVRARSAAAAAAAAVSRMLLCMRELKTLWG